MAASRNVFIVDDCEWVAGREGVFGLDVSQGSSPDFAQGMHIGL